MKKFVAVFQNLELDVYAETQEEARKRAIAGFVSQLENELDICDGSVRTELCDICLYAFSPSHVFTGDGEQICYPCLNERYLNEAASLNDIPF